MNWDLISDVILYASIAVLVVFAFLGIYQLIKRKSIKKVDKPLLFMLIPLVLMAIVYVVFDKFLVLNTRPNGSGEASFPSTHVMVVTTVFLLVTLILPRYLKYKSACIILDLFMLAFIVLVCFGRVLSNMHWLSDVLGALGFSLIFALIYFLFIRRKKHD